MQAVVGGKIETQVSFVVDYFALTLLNVFCIITLVLILDCASRIEGLQKKKTKTGMNY